MVLAYIWIENYKGFVKQGFNFASEYKFNFNINNSKLYRTSNELYIKDFFGSEVSSVIGVVGKNSSGKTNVLELVQYIVDGANTIINKPFLCVFKSGNEFKVYQYKMGEVSTDFPANLQEYPGNIPNISSIFFSNVFDGRKHNFSSKTINLSTNEMLVNQFGDNAIKNYQKTIQQQIRFINNGHFSLLEQLEEPEETVKLRPSQVILTTPVWANIVQRIKLLDNKLERETPLKIQLKDFVLGFKKKITVTKNINSLKYITAFLVYIDFLLNRRVIDYVERGLYKNAQAHYDDLESVLKITQVSDLKLETFYEYIIKEFCNKVDDWNLYETHEFLERLDRFDLGGAYNVMREDLGTYSSRRIEFTLDYNKEVGSFLNAYLRAVSNHSLMFSIEWAGMSSGHKAFLNLFSNFYSASSRTKNDNVIISIDEGDLYFHPRWQVEFLFKLITVLPVLLGKTCQLILTTHSPFLVSDLPKDNLVFIEKNANGNLQVLSNGEIEGNTFGGNIGELYVDAFFMGGKMISHFAASKIKQLLEKVLNSDAALTSQDKILVKVIGDDMIRNQIEALANDKN
jgi:hypothetical protein